MDYKTIRNQIEDMVSDNHKDFVKAVISMEKGINDESALDKLYEAYMDNDSLNLLHEEFDYMIEDLREQGQIKDLPYVQEEKDNLVNIVGNIVGKVDVVKGKIRTEKPLRWQISLLFLKMMRGIRYIIIAPHMEKRVIFQSTLSREILLSSLGRSEPPLMITARNILTSGYFLQSS